MFTQNNDSGGEKQRLLHIVGDKKASFSGIPPDFSREILHIFSCEGIQLPTMLYFKHKKGATETATLKCIKSNFYSPVVNYSK